MTTTTISEAISPALRAALCRLKLGRMLDTLPERLALARAQQTPYQDFLLLVLSDEVARRDSQAATLRAQRAHLDTTMQLEAWDPDAKVTFDRMLLNELASLRFVEAHAHVAIVGPVGVGKTFFAHALGHLACRSGHTVLALRADVMLKRLKHARLDNSFEAELRRLLAPDLLILDDFALDAMDATESRDAYDVLTERHRAGSMIVTSNRSPDEWLTAFSDPMRAQSAIDRFMGNSYDLVIEGESYRRRQKPRVGDIVVPAPERLAPSSEPAAQSTRPPPSQCLHCGAAEIIRRGWRNNALERVQMYQCRRCGRAFSSTKRTPAAERLAELRSQAHTDSISNNDVDRKEVHPTP